MLAINLWLLLFTEPTAHSVCRSIPAVCSVRYPKVIITINTCMYACVYVCVCVYSTYTTWLNEFEICRLTSEWREMWISVHIREFMLYERVCNWTGYMPHTLSTCYHTGTSRRVSSILILSCQNPKFCCIIDEFHFEWEVKSVMRHDGSVLLLFAADRL